MDHRINVQKGTKQHDPTRYFVFVDSKSGIHISVTYSYTCQNKL